MTRDEDDAPACHETDCVKEIPAVPDGVFGFGRGLGPIFAAALDGRYFLFGGLYSGVGVADAVRFCCIEILLQYGCRPHETARGCPWMDGIDHPFFTLVNGLCGGTY